MRRFLPISISLQPNPPPQKKKENKTKKKKDHRHEEVKKHELTNLFQCNQINQANAIGRERFRDMVQLMNYSFYLIL